MSSAAVSLDDILDFLKQHLPFMSLEPTFALTKYNTDSIGVGLQTKERIPKNAFVVEYGGEWISFDEAEKCENIYTKMNAGCYIYFCTFKRMKVW
jgi:hypothetical protein